MLLAVPLFFGSIDRESTAEKMYKKADSIE